jgi:hypothetical protein
MLALVGGGECLPPYRPPDRELIHRLAGPSTRGVPADRSRHGKGPERIAYWLRPGVEYFSSLGVQVGALSVIDRASGEDAGDDLTSVAVSGAETAAGSCHSSTDSAI